jgi:tetratricopeptide (TPR) repeat protein
LEDQIKRQLHDSITVREDAAKVLVVYGLGGAGKSQLVLGYVRAFRQDYSSVFVVDASGKASIELNYIQIYRKLHGIHSTLASENIEVDVAIEAVKSWLTSRNERCLFVFDAADELDDKRAPNYFDMHRYLPSSSPHLDVVITTRSRTAADSSNLEPVEVGDLSLGEATELFLRCSKTGNPSANMTKEVATIVGELGCLALAVALAGAYVAATDHIGVKEFLSKYRDRRIEVLKRKATRNAHNYQESVLTTWEMTHTAILTQCPAAAGMLSFLAFLSNNDILLQILGSSSLAGSTDSAPEWQRIFSPDIPLEEVVDEVFETLAKYSLIKWNEDTGSYSMHKLVHAWGHDRLPVKARAKYSAAALECLATTSLRLDSDPTLRARLAPHIMANFSTISGWFDTLDDTKESTFASIVLVADFLKGAGLYGCEKDLRMFEYKKREDLSPAGGSKLFRAMNELAVVLQRLGKYEEAVALHRQVLEGREKTLGKEHPRTLASLNNLAVVLQDQGDHNAARQLHQRALEGWETVLGKEHPDTLTGVNNLAEVLREQGDLKAAEKLHRQALKGRESVLGKEHLNTLQSVNNLAVVLQDQGDHKAVEELHRRALEGREKALGKEHPSTLASLNNLAAVLYDKGEYKAAEELHRRALEGWEKALGKEHPDTLTSVHNLAAMLQDQGNYKAAEELHRRALEGREKVLGKEHPDTLTSVRCERSLRRLQQQPKDVRELEYSQVAYVTGGYRGAGGA